LVEVKRLNPVDAQQNRSLSFNPTQMGPNQLNGDFLINGLEFDMDVVNFSIPLNNIEIWSLRNFSGIAHPFHIHDVQFFILDRNGVPPPKNEQGRKDVVLVQPMETVRFITQFSDFANDSVPYMLHCHMLTHEDKGMMLQFEVVDKTTGINKNKQLQNSINVYPNPVKSGKSISVTGIYKEYVSFAVYSLSGQILINGETVAKKNTIEVDLKGIEPGTYFLKMLINNEVYSNPIIIVN
jgi:bilirubin oxidase